MPNWAGALALGTCTAFALTKPVIQLVKDSQVLPADLQLQILGPVEAEGVEIAGNGLPEQIGVGFGPAHLLLHGPLVVGGHGSAGTPERLPATSTWPSCWAWAPVRYQCLKGGEH